MEKKRAAVLWFGVGGGDWRGNVEVMCSDNLIPLVSLKQVEDGECVNREIRQKQRKQETNFER